MSKVKTVRKGRKNLQNINKELLSKIDGILDDYAAQEKIQPIQMEQSTNDENSDFTLPIIIPKNLQSSTEPRKPPPKKGKQKKKAKKSTTYMTDVGLIKQTKSKKNEPDPLIENINKQINDVIENIDTIDDDGPKKEPEGIFKQGKELRDLINDIDEYKNKVHEEFDEIKWLIKFSDNTHKLIDRHKNVMTNIFKGAGIKPRGGFEEEEVPSKPAPKKPKDKPVKKYNPKTFMDNDDDIEDDQPHYKNGYYYRRAREDDNDLNSVFTQLQKINKIKDNLSNIQDDFLGYHQNLKQKIKENHK